jgi:heme/copper-type cytochrome/quinol oxidase subunit 2
MGEQKEKIDPFQEYVYMIGGIISFISLIILFYQNIKLQTKNIIINSIIIIIFSEMLNSLLKIINILKNDKIGLINEICNIQKYIGIFSDICTPLSNVFLSREIYYFINYNDSSSLGLKPSYYIYLLTLIIPLIITIIFGTSEKYNENIDQYSCYIKKNLFIVIIIIIILLIIISIYSFLTYKISKKKFEEYKNLEEELNSDNEDIINDNNQENYQTFKKTLKFIKQQNIKFAIFVLLVWIILIIIRLFYWFRTNGKEKFKDPELEKLFRLHCVLASCRGIFFYIVYMNKIICCEKEKKKEKNNNQLTPELKIDKINNLVNSNTNNTINDDENEIYKPFDDEIISSGLK